MTRDEAVKNIRPILASYEDLTGHDSNTSVALRTAIETMENMGRMPDLRGCRRLIRDMQETAQLVTAQHHTAEFALKLCGLKLVEAAGEFGKLVRYLERIGEDRG